MEKNFKLKAKIGFIDLKGKRTIPQGVMFYDTKERALLYVERGLADIVERGVEPVEAKEEVKQVVNEEKVEKPVVKPAPVKKPAAKKQATKTPAKKTAKK